MKPIMLIGIVLIVLGVVALAYQGITYTSREKIIDIGPSRLPVRPRRPSRCHPFWVA